MELLKALNAVKIDPTPYYDILQDRWAESMATLPTQPEEPYLCPDIIREYATYARFKKELIDRLTTFAATVRANPPLRALLWHFQRQLCIYPEGHPLWKWPSFKAELGDDFGLFSLLGCLNIIPLMRKKYAEMGIPEEIIHDSAREMSTFNELHEIGYGQPGIPATSISWLRHYVEGRLFRLGRMEYKYRNDIENIEVYRNRNNGQVLALVNEPLAFTADGYVIHENETIAWESQPIRRRGKMVSGTPISPRGQTLRESRTLDLTKWECVLQKGDFVIDMHIPGGGGLTLEACGDSMRQVAAFTERFFPEKKARVFYCSSWLFNTLFEQKLPNSNITKFMQQLYLFPVTSGVCDGCRFVFCRDYDDWSQAPRDTSLRRVMVDELTSVGYLRSGGMFYLVDDLDAFGTGYYRSQAR